MPASVDTYQLRFGSPVNPHEHMTKIHPHNPKKTKWDLFVAAVILYSVVFVPYRICFNRPAKGIWFALDIVFDLIFLVDVALNFATAYFDDHGELRWDTMDIMQNYLKGWFWIDTLSTLPIDHIVKATGGSGNLRLIKLLRMIRLVRLFKLIKLVKFDQFFDDNEDMIPVPRSMLSVIALLLEVVFLAHLVACAFYFLAADASDGTLTWASHRFNDEGDNSDSWKTSIPHSTLYTASLYWAVTTMTTVGYGDVLPVNDSEIVFAVVVIFIGASTFGYILGMVSLIIENSDTHARELKRRTSLVENYFDAVNLPGSMAYKARKHFKHHFTTRGLGSKMMMERALRPLRERYANHGVYAVMRELSPNLLGFERDPVFVGTIIPMLKPIRVLHTEEIFCEGSVGWHCYWVMIGNVKLTKDLDSSGETQHTLNLSVGHSFGEEFVLSKSELSKYAAISEKQEPQCELSSITRQDMQEIFLTWPRMKQELKQSHERTMKQIQNSKVAVKEDGPKRKLSQRSRFRSQNAKVEKNELSTTEVMRKYGLMHPDFFGKTIWDLFVGVLVVYSVIVVPYRIAFNVVASGPFQFFDVLVDVMFTFDILLNFNTAYFDDFGALITDKKKLRIHYMKTSFTIDLLTTIPFDAIANAIGSEHPGVLRLTKLMRMFRLARLMKLVVLLQNGKLFETADDMFAQVHDGVSKLLSLFAGLFFCAHLIGCLWFWAGTRGDECEVKYNDHGDIISDVPGSCANNWMVAYWGEGWNDNHHAGDLKKSLGSKYVTSIYWALSTMTTVGYGDIRYNSAPMSHTVISKIASMSHTVI
jgi:CRP-like cAMP-binding protein